MIPPPLKWRRRWPLYFKEMQCDLVVLECGMGGMTDATNVVKTTVVSVFAEIGMDHMGFLGNTVEEIAAVKAGIIKPGTIAVSAAQRPEVSAVLQKTCAEKDTEYRESSKIRYQRCKIRISKIRPLLIRK